MDFLTFILACLYFMLPAYFANMAPIIVKGSFSWLKIPMDFNKKFDKYTFFGKNKTFRGLIFGVLFGIITTYIQYTLYDFGYLREYSLTNYSDWLVIGFLMGLGAIIGDLVESFFKRRLDIKPGKPLIPFDQIDFIIGALIFIYPLYQIGLIKVLTILFLSFFLHIIVNHSAYYLKIRKEKW